MRTLLCSIAIAAVLAGCSHRQTIETSNGPATVTESNDKQTVTVQGKQGTAVIGKGAVDAAKIGLPVYPGAVNAENAGYAATTKEGSGQMVVMTTPDPFDKVYAWYKVHMPAGAESMHTMSDKGSIAIFTIGKPTDKEQKVVSITTSNARTSIMLSSSTKR
jgi:hypothetical protein